ncbi:sensor histidine kinase [Actinomadura xylanilytica]|uniref:sensor histidine kinase n=1 Tax=Actinomadura xylanilytica TaxID=887459 RepID=UPI00255AD8FC|nr:sensor histidine kinase [Actinomadura xylanilytica]MDL4776406.1 sensor histidine kinase [Actinomadura xylanilytica]
MAVRPRIPFVRQVLVLQVGVVVVVASLGYGLVAWMLDDELRDQYGQRALTVARSVAADPAVAAAVEAGDPGRTVQPRAERVRARTGALFVVVTDEHGMRYSHPTPGELGRRVSTDPSEALAGREVVRVERGTLGLSARGKVPLYGPGGAVLGEVSVGFDARSIDRELSRALRDLGLFIAGALLLGVLASAAIGRRLKRQTLGLEPYELVELVQEREAVLHGVGEGVLAVDPAGRVAVCNVEAARLLGVAPERGAPAAGLAGDGALREVLTGRRAAGDLFVTAGERVLVVNRREVRHDGRDLGAVITLRDRTDLETLARELDSVRTLFDALRAQRHEYANRLHTLSGLIQLGHHEEAAAYMGTLMEDSGGRPPESVSLPDPLPDPYLQAFLSAKAAVAAEKGVRLVIGAGSYVPGRVAEPLDVTTVVGNLVDNAVEAARLGARRPARAEVELLGDGRDLHVTVTDSGDGVPDGLREAVFTDGVSTRDGAAGRPRGLGLGLARRTARARGGDVTLAGPDAPGGADGAGAEAGAVVVARLPGVLGAEAAR